MDTLQYAHLSQEKALSEQVAPATPRESWSTTQGHLPCPGCRNKALLGPEVHLALPLQFQDEEDSSWKSSWIPACQKTSWISATPCRGPVVLECFPPLPDRHCFDNMGSNWIELGQGRQNGQSINSNSSDYVLNTRLSTYIYGKKLYWIYFIEIFI